MRPGIDPGLRRVRAGSGYRYVDGRGSSASAADVARARALVIPPAWTQVWICADARGHIQATGIDAAGRRQYLYHPDWVRRRDRGKYARALRLAAALPAARARVTAALRSDGLRRERVLAVAFRLLDAAAVRMGSRAYLVRYGSRGLTTLQRRDASVSGSVVTLDFPGKGGIRRRHELDDEDLAAAVSELTAGRPGAPLLAYRRGRRRVALSPREVNGYLRELIGDAVSAKDFRTLRGTIAAARSLAAGPAGENAEAEREAVEAAADALGNTPAVARTSYIDPRVFDRYRAGERIDTTVSPETGIRELLGE